MKPESNKAFFEAVEGKKITWTGWRKDQYFIPDTLDGRYILGIDEEGEGLTLLISNGFEPDEKGRYWSFWITPPEPEYVPFECIEDVLPHVDKWIKYKSRGLFERIYTIKGIHINGFPYDLLFKEAELVTIQDGKIIKTEPCGKVKKCN